MAQALLMQKQILYPPKQLPGSEWSWLTGVNDPNPQATPAPEANEWKWLFNPGPPSLLPAGMPYSQ